MYWSDGCLGRENWFSISVCLFVCVCVCERESFWGGGTFHVIIDQLSKKLFPMQQNQSPHPRSFFFFFIKYSYAIKPVLSSQTTIRPIHKPHPGKNWYCSLGSNRENIFLVVSSFTLSALRIRCSDPDPTFVGWGEFFRAVIGSHLKLEKIFFFDQATIHIFHFYARTTLLEEKYIRNQLLIWDVFNIRMYLFFS